MRGAAVLEPSRYLPETAAGHPGIANVSDGGGATPVLSSFSCGGLMRDTQPTTGSTRCLGIHRSEA